MNPVRAALILWALVVVAALVARAGAIAALDTLDPDDALRLVQVRDLIAGQSWWDVTQHRINPADGGGLMHWSRIVDAPLAAIILLLRPMLGQHGAEMAASAFWPLALLLPLMLVAVRTALLLGDRRIAYAAPLLIVANQLILYQYLPLRIDHHGWQILMQGAMLMLALAPANARNGALAGLCAAVLILISLEGLPAVTLFAGLFALHWLWTGDLGARARLVAMLGTLATAAVILQWATRGPDGLIQRWCDGVSLPWLAALTVAAGVVAAGAMAVRQAMPDHIASRAAILAVGGGAALATLLWIAPECRNGPFAALDPLVDHFWYRNVREGLPLFTYWDELVGFSLAPTLVGLIGSVMAWRRSGDAHRAGWLIVCVAMAGTGILSLLVMRTASAAHVMAVPGTAWLLIHAWQRARALGRPLPRIAASLACMALFPPTAGAGLGMIIAALSPTATHRDPALSNACVDGASTAPFAAMPPQRLFTPLDIAPHLLQRTPHAVIATGHHRNNAVMAQVIAAFIGPADAAEPRVRATGATMLVICPGAQEIANFAKAPGNSLTDDLLAGRTPAWLEPVALPAGSPLRAWRVRPVGVRPSA